MTRQPAVADAVTALIALIIGLTPLREHLASPGLWVVAEVSAAVLVVLVLFGREGVLGRIYAVVTLGGLVFLALWLLVFERMVVLPLILVHFWLRAVRLVRDRRADPMTEVGRTIAALMAGGIPAAIAHAWVGSAALTETLLSVLFFAAAAALRVWPLASWPARS